jgi:hypothetical protein
VLDANSQERRTHKVTRATVVSVGRQRFGIDFEFDDGEALFATDAGDQEAAEFYAKNLLGEELPVGIHPLLLSAEKIEEIKKARARR